MPPRFLPALILSVVLCAAALLAPARADCENDCMVRCTDFKGNLGVVCANSCIEQCKKSAVSYGAIAYGRTSGAWGTSYKWGSQAKAESVAMQTCAQHGNDCEVMVWFDRKCGAVASGEGTDAFWGLGDTDGQARADAQNKCVNGGGKDCQIQVSECSR